MFLGRIILIAVIVFLFYRFVRVLLRLPGGTKRTSFPRPRAPEKTEEMVKDPCCGVYVPLSEAKSLTVDGKRYYFCSTECMETYRKEKNLNQ